MGASTRQAPHEAWRLGARWDAQRVGRKRDRCKFANLGGDLVPSLLLLLRTSLGLVRASAMALTAWAFPDPRLGAGDPAYDVARSVIGKQNPRRLAQVGCRLRHTCPQWATRKRGEKKHSAVVGSTKPKKKKSTRVVLFHHLSLYLSRYVTY